MNGSDQPKPNKWLTKRLLRLVSLVSFVGALIPLILCLKMQLQGKLLIFDENATNSIVVKSAFGMIKNAYSVSGLIPGMSVLIIINALLLLACAKKFYTKSDK